MGLADANATGRMPAGGLSGRVALVTGAQQGIGRAAALALAEAGADVVVNWLDDPAAGEEVAAAVRGVGRSALLVQADVSDVRQSGEMIQKTVACFGRLDILVNNAGIFPRVPFLDMTEALWDSVLSVNLKGAAFCSQAAARAMVEANAGGAIVNMTSQALRGSPRGAHYSSSKAGLLGLTRTMALELAPHRIRVNAIAPGLIDTAQPRGGYSEEGLAGLVAAIPLGRFGRSTEVADAIVFLCSDASSFMTGELLHVNGGAYMA
jgi:NAD(P)-dependent dehydrogenase (short-subunit alcohol dehydrogenase family)